MGSRQEARLNFPLLYRIRVSKSSMAAGEKGGGNTKPKSRSHRAIRLVRKDQGEFRSMIAGGPRHKRELRLYGGTR